MHLRLAATHCAWKSTSTGSSLLITRSVKSSWSWTLKETFRRGERGRERGERKDALVAVHCSEEVEKEEVAAAVDAGRLRTSFAESVQILRSSSL